MKILVVYDGTLNAKKALTYAIGKTRKEGGELSVLQVFDRQLFVDYDAGPRAEEMARQEAALFLSEARRIAADQGLPTARFVEKEGPLEEVVLGHIAEEKPDLVVAASKFRSLTARSPRPVRTIPGTILVPVDSSGALPAFAAEIAEEASSSASDIMLLGVVPVHLYNKEEKEELAMVTAATTAAVSALRLALAEKGLAASEAIRTGYPDEEILAAAEEHQVSLVLLPSGGTTPSELTKAAAILLDEPERMRWPVMVLQLDTA